MEPLELEPATLGMVFDFREGGTFKPYGLFKFMISDVEPTLDTTKDIPSLPQGLTMNPVDDFYTYNAMDNKRLWVFNLSHRSNLLIERVLT